MQQRPFGTTGLSVAPLGIGSMAIPADAAGRQAVLTAMNELLDAGSNLVDTAQIYGESEAFIGEHLGHRRQDFVLISKCGHHEVLPDGSMRSLAISMADIDGALQRLRTDYLDAMLLHSYDYVPLIQGDAIAVLLRAKEQGKIRHAGYSGDAERAAWAVANADLTVLETSVNVVDQDNLPHLELAAENGTAIIAKRPLANAAWRFIDDRAAAHETVVPYIDRWEKCGLSAETFGCASLGELALRFTIGLPGAPCAIVSAKSPGNRAANIAAADKGPLSAEHMQKIRATWEQAARTFGPWPGIN